MLARSSRSFRTRLAVLLALLAAGCASSRETATAGDPYVLVLLRTGPDAGRYSKEERGELQQGHLATIVRLTEAGELVVAGPCGQPNPDPTLRGIYVFDAADPAEVEAHVAADPAIAGGVLAVEPHRMRTSYDLVARARRDLAASEARRRAGDDRMEAGMRAYVFALSDDAAAFERALAGDARLVFTAQLDGGPRGFHLLDTADLAAAESWLAPLAGPLGTHSLHPWYGSEELARPSDAP